MSLWDQSIWGALTLGKVLEALTVFSPKALTPYGFTSVDSYRGYYEELAGSPGEATIGAMISLLDGATGQTFEGYKGGDFVMTPNTGLWLAVYGDTGEPTTTAWLKLIELTIEEPSSRPHPMTNLGIHGDNLRQAENKRRVENDPDLILCEWCGGTGNEFYSMYRACPECDGLGVLTDR